jgi:VanZ family protein
MKANEDSRGIQRWIPAWIVMALIFIASSLPAYDLPHFGVLDFIIKKGGHMAGYAMLSIAFLYGLRPNRRSYRRSIVLALCFAVVYAVSDELHQTFIAGRNGSPADVLVDTAGAAFGSGLWTFVHRRNK